MTWSSKKLSDQLTTLNSNTQLLSNRVNTIISLPDGSTTNDARLEDICNGYNNTTVYTSPGDAVRTQISDVYDFIDDSYTNLKEKYKITINNGYYLKNESPLNFNHDANITSYYTGFIRVFPGEKYCYVGRGTALAYSVYWFDENKAPLTYEQYDTNSNAVIIIVPNDAVYAIFQSYGTKLQIYLNDTPEIINRVNNSEKSDIPFYELSNKYLHRNGNIYNDNNCTGYVTDFIQCIAGDIFIYNGVRERTNIGSVCAVAWYGYDKKCIGYIDPDDYDDSADVELTVPENAYYARFGSYVFNSNINKLHLSVRYKNITSVNSKKIQSINNDIDRINDNLSILFTEDRFDVKDDNKIDICKIEDMHNDGYIHFNTGRIVVDPNVGAIYSDYFNLNDYSNIYITSKAQFNTSILVLYDINNNFIASIDKNKYDDFVIVTDKLYNVQELIRKYPNAVKFRLGAFQFPNGSNTNFRAYTYQNNQSLHEKVNSIENSISNINSNINIITGTGNVLYGKKYVAAGDSFTQGDFNGYVDSDGLSGKSSPYLYDSTLKMYKTYPWQIATRNNMSIVNEAICGTTMAIHRNYFFDPENFDEENATHFANNRYKAIPDDADYLTLCFGLNEQGTWPINPNSEHYPTDHPELAGTKIVPYGTSSDTTDKTIWGAWNLSLDYIIEHHPFLKIGIIIPDAWTDTTMHNTLIAIAKYWGIPYLDLKNGENVPVGLGGRLEGTSDRIKTLRNNAMYVTQSNGHPNLEAHKYRSTIIENFLRSL